MPLPDITNPDYIKFFVESCEKTARLRQKWNLMNQAKLQQAATLTREDKGLTDIDVIRETMVGGMSAITRDHVSSGYNRRRTPIRDTKTIPGISSLRKEYSIPAVGMGDPKEDPRLARPDTDLTPDPMMRPVDPKQTRILYKLGAEFGRKMYIKTRNHMNPEDKYYFAETSGWDYGWRLKDTPFGRNRPRCGRVQRLRRDQMSRVGPQPDPYYYKDASNTMATPCGN